MGWARCLIQPPQLRTDVWLEAAIADGSQQETEEERVLDRHAGVASRHEQPATKHCEAGAEEPASRG